MFLVYVDYFRKKTNRKRKKMKFLLFTFVGAHLFALNSGKPLCRIDTSQRTFQEIKEEIARYGDVAKAIIDLAVYGKAQNRSYERLALLVDTVGPRLSGSKGLEKAIQIMCQNLKEDGLENVHLEPVRVPHWERGEESAVMLEPRRQNLAILGLGSSIGTPPEGTPCVCVFSSQFAVDLVKLMSHGMIYGSVHDSCYHLGDKKENVFISSSLGLMSSLLLHSNFLPSPFLPLSVLCYFKKGDCVGPFFKMTYLQLLVRDIYRSYHLIT